MRSGALLSVVEIAVSAGLIVRMAVVGFVRKPAGRLLSWSMFCTATFTTRVCLTGTTSDGRTEQINVYDYVVPGSFIVTPRHLQQILDHLADRYTRIDGHGQVISPRGVRDLTVRSGRVVS